MTQSTIDAAHAAALLAVDVLKLKTQGLSFSEIAAALSTPGRKLTRNAALGIYHRLKASHEIDARDLRICDELKAKALTVDKIAKGHGVTVEHVQELKREAGL